MRFQMQYDLDGLRPITSYSGCSTYNTLGTLVTAGTELQWHYIAVVLDYSGNTAVVSVARLRDIRFARTNAVPRWLLLQRVYTDSVWVGLGGPYTTVSHHVLRTPSETCLRSPSQRRRRCTLAISPLARLRLCRLPRFLLARAHCLFSVGLSHADYEHQHLQRCAHLGGFAVLRSFAVALITLRFYVVKAYLHADSTGVAQSNLAVGWSTLAAAWTLQNSATTTTSTCPFKRARFSCSQHCPDIGCVTHCSCADVQQHHVPRRCLRHVHLASDRLHAELRPSPVGAEQPQYHRLLDHGDLGDILDHVAHALG